MSVMTAGVIIGGATLISGYMGSEAAKDAADAGAESSERAIASQEKASALARQDIFRTFPQAQQSLLLGAQGAIDIFQQGIPEQQQQLAAGNLAAQRTIAQGLPQVQAALLGTGIQGFQPQGVPFGQERQKIDIIGDPTVTEFGDGTFVAQPTFQGLGNVPQERLIGGENVATLQGPAPPTEEEFQAQLQAQADAQKASGLTLFGKDVGIRLGEQLEADIPNLLEDFQQGQAQAQQEANILEQSRRDARARALGQT